MARRVTPSQTPSDAALRRLARPLALTRAGMVAERVARAFWPVWTGLVALMAAHGLGLGQVLAPDAVLAGSGLALVALIWGLVRGVRLLRWPHRAEVLDRLDRSLAGRPVAALSDRQAVGVGDAASEAVWRAHVARMARAVEGARAVAPDLRLSARDPLALRYAALLALVVALGFGGYWRAPLSGPLGPGGVGDARAAGPAYEGWIAPPLYTGKPTIYLNEAEDRAALLVPEGSTVTVRLYGGAGTVSLHETVSGGRADGTAGDTVGEGATGGQIADGEAARGGAIGTNRARGEGTVRGDAAQGDVAGDGTAGSDASRGDATGQDRPRGDASAPAQEFAVVQDGTLELSGALRHVWRIDMLPDAAPEVAVEGEIAAGLRGEMTLTFRAGDDYGVRSGEAVIALDLAAVDRRYGLAAAPEPREAIVLDLPMPFAGDRTDFTDDLVEDFSRHPWAGLPVTVVVSVRDGAGQEGRAAPVHLALPGRRFFEPLAAALAEQRRDLLWSRDNARRVAQVLRAVTNHPEDVFESTRAYLVVRIALRRLEAATPGGLAEAARDEVAELLWHAALLIEEGDLSDALARLRRAQDRLSEALEQGASDEEIAALTQELRDAMRDYLEQMAREAEDNPDQQMSQGDQQQTITPEQLQQLLDRIEQLSREGRTAEAQQLLDQLRQMMENMRMTRGAPQQGDGQQSMRGLQDTLRQQQGLSDEAFRRLQEQFNGEAQSGDSDQNEGSNGQRGRGQSHDGLGRRPGRAELAERQQALREMLERQREGLPGAGTEGGDSARDALNRAGRAMDKAGRNIEDGDLSEALDNQAEAMQALREGIRELGQAMADRQPGQGEQGLESGDARPDSRRDPLGRRVGNNGQIGSDRDMLPGDEIIRRARELLGEIRRRSGDRSRPEMELEYLRRLLDRF